MVTAIIAVFIGSALLGLLAWLFGKDAEKSERDPKYYRRSMYVVAAFFLLPMINGIVGVVNGSSPKSNLLGALIPLGFAWLCFRAGKRGLSSQSDSPAKKLK